MRRNTKTSAVGLLALGKPIATAELYYSTNHI
jgi:hypothetical protein